MNRIVNSMQPPSFATPAGYHGRYLRIDVSSGNAQCKALADDVLRRFIGGSGLGTYMLLKERCAGVEPLAPDAGLAFVFSPLVGSPLTTSAKFAIVSKSPLTDRINDSLASSAFAIAGKKTGSDALFITGRAPEPSVLIIDDGNVRLEPAGELWGLTCDETQRQLAKKYGADFEFAVIGPAGENGVRYATISHQGRHAGRGGSGAVLGAKNVKAVAVRGSQRCRWSQPRELARLAKQLSDRSFGPATAKYRELGTAANLLVFNRLKTLPTLNFQRGSFHAAADISPEALGDAREKTRAYCAACTIGCEHIYSLHRGPANVAGGDGVQRDGVRVEYENLFALGSLCGVSDPDAVLAASQRCDQLGIDTISAGGTIAFAMECVQRGLLQAPWLRFGDGQALLQAIEQIGHRAELGDRLAEGSRRLAAHIGQDSIHFAPQVKGLEIPGYEPRGLQTMALGFSVGTRGADHNRSGAYEVDFSGQVDRRHATPEAAVLAAETEDKAALMDSLILCKFIRGVFEDLMAESARMLNLVTGWDTTAEELRETAERIVTARKWFNIQAGWTPAEDTLPERFLSEPLSDDAAASLSRDQLDQLISAYNRHRGWGNDGWIDEDQLRQLELSDL